MEPSLILVAIILFISTVIQFTASGVAFSLVDLSDRNKSWLMIAIAFLLMSFRRTISFSFIIFGHTEHTPDIAVETVALLTSVLILIGILKIGPLFGSVQKASRDRLHYSLELEDLNKELESMTIGLAEKVYVPACRIDEYTSSIVKEIDQQGTVADHKKIDRLRSESDYLIKFVGKLRNFMRVSRTDISFEPVNISKIVESISTKLNERFDTVTTSTAIEDGIIIETDRHLIEIVLDNLLENAYIFSGDQKNREIEFGCRRGDRHPTFLIRDNGKGFDSNQCRVLFKPFSCLGHHPEQEGAGLGLATVAKIIRRLGGRIWVESRKGDGTTFYFTAGSRLIDM